MEIYGKYIYVWRGRYTCVCEGIAERMASGRVGVLVCVTYEYVTVLSLFLYF